VLLDGPGRCAEHRRPHTWASAKATGYSDGYDTPRWRRTRTLVLTRDAHRCTHPDHTGPHDHLQAHHVNHLRHTDPGFYDPDEAVTLCRACHRRVTAQRAAARKQGLA
jgi:5-methylcytosine-specific restriction endonuclease McrA